MPSSDQNLVSNESLDLQLSYSIRVYLQFSIAKPSDVSFGMKIYVRGCKEFVILVTDVQY